MTFLSKQDQKRHFADALASLIEYHTTEFDLDSSDMIECMGEVTLEMVRSIEKLNDEDEGGVEKNG